jgi:site-specific DNA recombinase
VDSKKTKSIIAIKPKPPFKPVFQVAASKKDSNIRILNEPLEGSSLFLVETGETLSLPETGFYLILRNIY